ISRRTFERLYDIGSGVLLKEIALDASYGAACAARLPLAVQKQVFNNGVEVLQADGSIARKLLPELSSYECQKVFARDKVLSVAEQKNNRPRALPPMPAPYDLLPEKGLVRFHECELNADQLAALAEELRRATLVQLQQSTRERLGAAKA